MRSTLFIFPCYLLLVLHCYSQNENQSQLQNRYVSITSQNDLYQYWLQSDKYFTNGIHLEVAHEKLGIKPVDWFLIGFKRPNIKQFCISVGQTMHTPQVASETIVDSTDRPYAGQLFIKYEKNSNDFYKGTKLIAQWYFGVQGPASGAKETQNFIHGITPGSPNFEGWDNQLSNGLIFDYSLALEKLTPLSNSILETSVCGNIHIGTLYNYTYVGLRSKFGLFNDSYASTHGNTYFRKLDKDQLGHRSLNKTRKRQFKITEDMSNSEIDAIINERVNRNFQLYGLAQFNLGAMLYDGTAQGSLVQFSPNLYEYTSNQIDPLILSFTYGITASYNKWTFRFSRIVQNDNFKKGDLFGWGEFALFFSLN